MNIVERYLMNVDQSARKRIGKKILGRLFALDIENNIFGSNVFEIEMAYDKEEHALLEESLHGAEELFLHYEGIRRYRVWIAVLELIVYTNPVDVMMRVKARIVKAVSESVHDERKAG